MWREVYSKLEIEHRPLPREGDHAEFRHRSRPRPSKQAIKLFEHEFNFKLPPTYCAFIHTFGPGTIGGYVKFPAPGYPDEGDSIDLSLFNKESPRYDFDLNQELYEPHERRRVERMIFFGCTIGGDYVGWDPEDPTDPGSHEYGIYLLEGIDTPRRICTNFNNFIINVCLGDEFDNIFGKWDKLERQTFEPCFIFND